MKLFLKASVSNYKTVLPHSRSCDENSPNISRWQHIFISKMFSLSDLHIHFEYNFLVIWNAPFQFHQGNFWNGGKN